MIDPSGRRDRMSDEAVCVQQKGQIRCRQPGTRPQNKDVSRADASVVSQHSLVQVRSQLPVEDVTCKEAVLEAPDLLGSSVSPQPNAPWLDVFKSNIRHPLRLAGIDTIASWIDDLAQRYLRPSLSLPPLAR